MGLFWSMKPEKPRSRLSKNNVLSPLTVDIDVCQDADDVLLASETNVRHFLKEGMKRIEVKEGRIRGVLFLPPGDGPFPGVVDLYTFGGGLCEIRASLLANKGFAVLALAFYKYQDLPKTVPECFELEYFEEGITFLRGYPQVKSSGVGVLCLSKSGDFALAMASYLEGVSATAWVNGCNAVNVIPLSYKGVVMPPVELDPAAARFTEDGLIIRDVITDPSLEKNQGSVIHVEQASGRFLFAASEDDMNWNSCMFAEQAVARLRDHGKDTYELVRYPNAGHLLETPYTALCTTGIHAALGMAVVFGGEAKAHCEAQLDLWKRVQEFFRNYV
ncbi:acyl-coenzyme A thioesterase 1-like [Aplochiton taeniatus]